MPRSNTDWANQWGYPIDEPAIVTSPYGQISVEPVQTRHLADSRVYDVEFFHGSISLGVTTCFCPHPERDRAAGLRAAAEKLKAMKTQGVPRHD